MTQNVLARSRLEAAQKMNDAIIEVQHQMSATHSWKGINPENETIAAALNALLNPDLSDEVIRAGANTKVFGCEDIVGFMTALNCHKAIIDELTRET